MRFLEMKRRSMSMHQYRRPSNRRNNGNKEAWRMLHVIEEYILFYCYSSTEEKLKRDSASILASLPPKQLAFISPYRFAQPVVVAENHYKVLQKQNAASEKARYRRSK